MACVCAGRRMLGSGARVCSWGARRHAVPVAGFGVVPASTAWQGQVCSAHSGASRAARAAIVGRFGGVRGRRFSTHEGREGQGLRGGGAASDSDVGAAALSGDEFFSEDGGTYTRGAGAEVDASHPYPSDADAADSRLFCDPAHKAMIDEILRVDHAGEYAAVRIYQGQMDVLQGDKATFELLAEMKATEDEHLSQVKKAMAERRVRPTALLPLWNVAGYALGAGTAMLGKEAAMACTVAVETVIGEHYNDQIRSLLGKGYREEELIALLKKNRDEELEHLDTGLAHNAEQAPMYDVLSNVIKTGCRAAVWVAKRV